MTGAAWSAACWFLTGPTASGKSSVALAVAEAAGAEILALDSMTVYRGMDVGTAKPSTADRARIPHHLLDLLEASEPASVAWYLGRAEAAARDVLSRGKQPLFVGGSPLYLKACLRGLFDGPPAHPELRARLEAEAEHFGTAVLHARLAEVDPLAAERILVGDLRRIVRALEVHEVTGRPISDWQQQFAAPTDPTPKVACVDRPREELRLRIAERVDQMLAAGWIEEVRRLTAGGAGLGREAFQAAGYADVVEHLAGRLDFAAMRERIVLRTRRFAKHQRTWFRHIEECRFFPTSAVESSEALTGRLLDFFQGRE